MWPVSQIAEVSLEVVTLNCPRCNAPLDVEPGKKSFACQYCGCALEVVREGSDREYRLEERLEPVERRVVPCPQSLKIEEWGGGLTIWWRWFSPALIFMAFFCIAWDSFLLVWYGMAFAGGGMAPWPFQLLMFVFPLAHVAVGVGLTYVTLAGFLNSTRVKIDAGTLSVTHGPIPWKSPPAVLTDDLEHIYVTQSTQKSDEGRSLGYAVHVLQRGGSTVELLKHLTDADKALCIADRLRRHLDLESRPVAGEYTG